MSTPVDQGGTVTAAALREWPLPQPDGAKDSRGRVLVVGGSASTPGAAMLAGLAVLRVGAGVLGLAVDEPVAPAVAAALPEASVTTLADLGPALDGCRAVLVGPGFDNPDPARAALEQVLAGVSDEALLVIDAFALGVLADVDGAGSLTGRAVLTPNRSEAARLLDTDRLDDDAGAVAAAIADRFQAVVTFQSDVAAPDGRRWTVPSGHPGLGTSGSGDVLAGAVAGLLARGADREQAACWATYLHATAGDRLAARIGRLGFLARELTAELPLVLVETEA